VYLWLRQEPDIIFTVCDHADVAPLPAPIDGEERPAYAHTTIDPAAQIILQRANDSQRLQYHPVAAQPGIAPICLVADRPLLYNAVATGGQQLVLVLWMHTQAANTTTHPITVPSASNGCAAIPSATGPFATLTLPHRRA
jgi:hypothetical protein